MIKTTQPQIMLVKELPNSTVCPNCSTQNSLKILSSSKYTHIACVPFYGFKSSIIVCSACSQEYQMENQNGKTKELAKINERCIKLPIRYFTWVIFLGGVLLLSLLTLL